MKKTLHISLLLLLIAFFFQCKKDNKILGIEVQPEDDLLGAQFLGGIPVFAHTVSVDSILSYNSNLKYLGSNVDPYFGKLDIGLCLNANMSVTNLDFGSAAILTSAEIVLALSNTDYAGDKNAALTFSVYALDSALNEKRAYYTNNYRLHNPLLLCTSTSTFVEGAQGPVLKIPVDSLYASKILTNSSFLKDNATFQANYKGFYITASAASGEGVIYNCDVEAGVSGFFLHYKAGTSASDTIQDFQFTFSGEKSSKFNTVKFSPSPPLSIQMNGDSTLGKENLYLKGMGATRLKVQIPFLRNIVDSFPMAVNRAEVIFNVDASFAAGTGNYNHPTKLALLPIDSIGREALTIDQSNTLNMTRYDGYYDAANSRYIFNIPLHAQAILKGNRKNYGFYLVVADPLPPYIVRRDIFIDRVILAGSNKTLKPTLNITYTPLKK